MTRRAARNRFDPPRPGCRAARALVLLILLALSAVSPAPAQLPGAPPTAERPFYSRQREFRIPFDVDPGERRISSVRLHVSDNQGQTWQAIATAQPGGPDRAFTFRAERDGWYLFAVQTVDQERRLYPAVMDARAPVGLRVCVDTREPAVTLQAVGAGDGNLGVSWAIQDDNLANLRTRPDAFILETRPAGAGGPWQRKGGDAGPTGQRLWSAESNAPVEVRLRVLDDAGNEGQATVTVTPGAGAPAGAGAGAAGARPTATGEGGPAAPRGVSPDGRRLVNSRNLKFNYDLQDVGKSGISVVELWYTDGRNWQLQSKKVNPKAPYIYEVDLEREGLYGFSLIALSGVGLGEELRPKVGDPPQVWLEADWTKPKVVLQNVEVGQGPDTGNLYLAYTAEDKNLDREGSITLSYAESLDGPWTAFAKNIHNTGRYTWVMPPTVPFQMFLRIEAADRAGNIGKDETSRPVKVDLARPKVRVLNIDSILSDGAPARPPAAPDSSGSGAPGSTPAPGPTGAPGSAGAPGSTGSSGRSGAADPPRDPPGKDPPRDAPMPRETSRPKDAGLPPP